MERLHDAQHESFAAAAFSSRVARCRFSICTITFDTAASRVSINLSPTIFLPFRKTSREIS
jgi:hypothetical protein